MTEKKRKGHVKNKLSAVLLMDVRAVLAVVGILRGIFDDVNVGTLCWVSRPLDGSPGPSDAQGDTVQEFEFWNEEVSRTGIFHALFTFILLH